MNLYLRTPISVLSDAYNRPPDHLVDDKELSRTTGISRRTFQNWRARRTGPPYVRAGRAVRYNLGEVHAWLRRNTQSVTAPEHLTG
jgi:predicted DNA-binding transcriptional regulator AlpA